MDQETVFKIKRYFGNIQQYRRTAPNECIKLSTRLYEEIVEEYFKNVPIPKELENVKCKTIYRLYRKIEPGLINCESEEEIINFFNRLERIILHPNFKISKLERLIKKPKEN